MSSWYNLPRSKKGKESNGRYKPKLTNFLAISGHEENPPRERR